MLTRGPWKKRLVIHQDGSGGYSELKIIGVDANGRGRVVAYKRVGGAISDEDEANFRLLRAAPLLLTACQAAVKRLEFFGGDGAKHYSPDNAYWIDLLNAAIARTEEP